MFMKSSKPSTLILILAVILVVGGLVYVFVIRGSSSSSSTDASLVSTTTGSKTSLPTAATSTGSTGDQVVTILRNLSSIQLSDAVFQNPAFTMLTDLSTSLPPATNPGRRNPFAPVGTDVTTSTPASTTTTTTTTTPSTSTPPTHASMGTGPAGF
jgi:hypothetical protein